MAAIDGEKRKERKTRKNKNKNRDGTPTKHKCVGEEGCECDQKTTKAASHIGECGSLARAGKCGIM